MEFLGTIPPLATWVWRFILISAIAYGIYKSAEIWVKYIRASYVENLKWSLLYIKLPKTSEKSIMAMEMVLNVLWQTGKTGDWLALFWKGQIRPWHTLEIVSIEGRVYFFIRTYSEFVSFLKSQIYAQYPDSEITEVDDYIKYIPKFESGKSDWNMEGFELKQSNEKFLFPIKTYMDYDLHIPGKAPERIDPLSNIVELIASLGPKEQYWIQIHVRAAANTYSQKDDPYKKTKWQDTFKGNIRDFEEDVQKQVSAGLASKMDFDKKRVTEYVTNYEREIYEKLQRHAVKNAFDVGVRCVYLAHKDMYRTHIHAGMTQVWRLFNAPGMNGFDPMNNTIAFDYDWDKPFGAAAHARKDNLYKAYINRSYFYPPNNEWVDEKPRKTMLLTTEELATIFHFPGEEVSSGKLSRIEARKAEPPINLPIS